MTKKKIQVTLPDAKQINEASQAFDESLAALTQKVKVRGNQFGAVDWDYWLLKPRFHDWEVAALLCDIPPDELLGSDSDSFAPYDWCGLEDEFRKRLAVITENSKFADYGIASGHIELPKLVKWLKANTKWKIPEPLEALCAEDIQEPKTPARRLADKEKQAIIKMDSEGKNSAEISKTLDIPASTIRQILKRHKDGNPTPSTIFKIKQKRAP